MMKAAWAPGGSAEVEIWILKSRPLYLWRARGGGGVLSGSSDTAEDARWLHMRARWEGAESHDAVDVRFKLRQNLHVVSGWEFGGK